MKPEIPEKTCCAPDCCSTDEQESPSQKNLSSDEVRNQVRDSYAKIAKASDAGQSSGDDSSCCGVSGDIDINTLDSLRLGYSQSDLQGIPEGANMGLGCGNPRAIASIQAGHVVLDLGSGGGFDAFLAAREVGETGYVIGVDMTPEMISKARNNADKTNFDNVEFRLGEIEHLPLADESVDVIISNCVINLSPDKPQVFREALRVLKKGARLAVSDVVATIELPESLRSDNKLYAGCMGGASLIDDLQDMLQQAGFEQIRISPKDDSRDFIRDWAPGSGVEYYVVSAHIEAHKPL